MLDIPSDDFKSASDPSIPFFSFKQKIGTAVLSHDCLNEFGCLCKTVVITNFDAVNSVSVVTKDPNQPADVIPPSTKGSQDEWISHVVLTPNAGTGNGLLELQLVKLTDAKDGMKIASKIKGMMSQGMKPQDIMQRLEYERTAL